MEKEYRRRLFYKTPCRKSIVLEISRPPGGLPGDCGASFEDKKNTADFPKRGTLDAVRAPRLFVFEKFREFLMAEKGQKSGFFRAIRAPRGCNGGPVELQRWPRCNAIAAPRQSKEGPAASLHPTLSKDRRNSSIINSCVTARCEKYRFLTEKWQQKYPSRDLKIWEHGRNILESGHGFWR